MPPVWKLRPQQLLITVICVVMAALVLVGLVLSGTVARSVGTAIGLGSGGGHGVEHREVAGHPGRGDRPGGASLLLDPNIKQPTFRWISVGAGIAIVMWVVACALFGLYVSALGHYNKAYGSLAGVVLFLLWLWITNLAPLFGAEVDSELERARELQSGIEAEEVLQLPPRDARGSDKRRAKARQRVEAGRALRESVGGRRVRRATDPGMPGACGPIW